MLIIYRDVPFSSQTEVDLDDFFTGDGTTTTFVLANKAVSRLGNTVEFDNTRYFEPTGGFSKTVNGFTLTSAPAANTQGIAPGLNTISFSELFDTTAGGVSNSQAIPLYIADISSDIVNWTYHGKMGSPGIFLSVVDMASAAPPQLSWIQMASSDSSGNALTYGATGQGLYTSDIQAYGTLLASSVAGASSITVDTASSFTVGDFILLGQGATSQESVQITSYTAPTTLTITQSSYKHSAGEAVYTCGRKFWILCTVPSGVASGLPINYYNLSLKTSFARSTR